jgi:DNA (cytosine-5)-methyltransferase 1
LNDRIPVIDLFAGPGGFAEGFSSFPSGAEKHFRICLSIEKDPYAHRTLELRSFFRQFPRGQVPEDYYQYLRKNFLVRTFFLHGQKKAEERNMKHGWLNLGQMVFWIKKLITG